MLPKSQRFLDGSSLRKKDQVNLTETARTALTNAVYFANCFEETLQEVEDFPCKSMDMYINLLFYIVYQ